MKEGLRQRFDELCKEIEALLERPPHVVASNLHALYESEPYRALRALGSDADLVELCVERIRAGGWFLNQLVLDLTGLSPRDLGIDDEFPSEQEIALAIVRAWDTAPAVTWVWTAATGAAPAQPKPRGEESSREVRTTLEEQHPGRSLKRTVFPVVADISDDGTAA